MIPVFGTTYPEPSPLDTDQAGRVARRVHDADVRRAARGRRTSQELLAIGFKQSGVQQTSRHRIGVQFMQPALDPRPVRKLHDVGQPREILCRAEAERLQAQVPRQFQREGDQDTAIGRRTD